MHSPRNLAPTDPAYPPRLAALAAPPSSLWVVGSLPEGRSVAIVGARAARRESLETARALGRRLAEGGRVVVSGGALGVDAAAHRGALDGGGAQIAVLGTGIDVPYPSQHRPLFAEIVDAGGALVSQFPVASGPTPWSFPARNRTIAALADVVVVIEAGSASGTRHTAAAARALRRPLVVLLGSPGCDQLAAQGAVAARSLDDLLAAVDGRPPEPVAPIGAAPQALYAVLDGTPRDLGELAGRSGLGAATIMAAAIELELQGLAARAPGGRYLRPNF